MKEVFKPSVTEREKGHEVPKNVLDTLSIELREELLAGVRDIEKEIDALVSMGLLKEGDTLVYSLDLSKLYICASNHDQDMARAELASEYGGTRLIDYRDTLSLDIPENSFPDLKQ